MSKRSVFCIASSAAQASGIVHDLQRAELAGSDISVLFVDAGASADRGRASAARAVDTVRGVSAQIVAAGAFVNPLVNPLVAAGPISVSLSSGTAGSIAGGFVNFGVPSAEAARYESRLKEGQVFISIQTENPDKSDEAREIFRAAGAVEILTMMQVSTPKLSARNALGMSRAAMV